MSSPRPPPNLGVSLGGCRGLRIGESSSANWRFREAKECSRDQWQVARKKVRRARRRGACHGCRRRRWGDHLGCRRAPARGARSGDPTDRAHGRLLHRDALPLTSRTMCGRCCCNVSPASRSSLQSSLANTSMPRSTVPAAGWRTHQGMPARPLRRPHLSGHPPRCPSRDPWDGEVMPARFALQANGRTCNRR